MYANFRVIRSMAMAAALAALAAIGAAAGHERGFGAGRDRVRA